MRREESLSGKIWRSSFLVDLFSGLFSNLFDLVADFIQTQQKRLLKRLSTLIVLVVGILFLLNALALFISAYLAQAHWVGYGIVGGVLVFLGLMFWKE